MKPGVHDFEDVKATKVYVNSREGPRDRVRLIGVFPWVAYGHQGAWERAHKLYLEFTKKGYSDGA